MLISASMCSLLGAFLNKSELLSHVTQRVVDGFGKGAENSANTPVVVVIEQLPSPSDTTMPGIDPTDWLRIPPPNRFMVYADNMDCHCMVGVFLEGIGTDPPAISWIQIDWDSPVSVDLPSNALGAFFAVLNFASGSLSIRRVDWCGAIDGYELLTLRDEIQNSYSRIGPLLR